MAKYDWLTFAPVLLVNLGSVFCCDGGHKFSRCSCDFSHFKTD
jgi:hypothetical protein